MIHIVEYVALSLALSLAVVACDEEIVLEWRRAPPAEMVACRLENAPTIEVVVDWERASDEDSLVQHYRYCPADSGACSADGADTIRSPDLLGIPPGTYSDTLGRLHPGVWRVEAHLAANIGGSTCRRSLVADQPLVVRGVQLVQGDDRVVVGVGRELTWTSYPPANSSTLEACPPDGSVCTVLDTRPGARPGEFRATFRPPSSGTWTMRLATEGGR